MAFQAAFMLVALAVAAVAVGFAAFWFVDSSGVPHPLNWILKLLIGLAGVIFLLSRAGFI